MAERRLDLALVFPQLWWHVLHAKLPIDFRFSLYRNNAPGRLSLSRAELLNSLLSQFQFSFRGDLFESLQVRFRPGHEQQSAGELIRLHRKKRRPESFAENG